MSSFLWLRVERPEAVASKAKEEEPYRQVAREILHWNGLPASNFRQMIKHQVQKEFEDWVAVVKRHCLG